MDCSTVHTIQRCPHLLKLAALLEFKFFICWSSLYCTPQNFKKNFVVVGQLILHWALIQRGLGTGRQKIQIKYSHLFLLFRKDGKLQLSQSKRRLRSKEKWPESRRSFRNNEKNSFVNSEPFQCVEYIGQNVVSTDVGKWLLLCLISGLVFRPLTASKSWHFKNWHS